MRKTKEEAGITRENVLDAAMKVFSKKGYTLSTLDDIAKEAGVTRGAIYWHFKGGKSDIFMEIVNKGFARNNEMLNEVLSKGGTPMQTIERLMVRLMAFVEEDDDFRALQELLIFKTETSPELSSQMGDKQHAQEESVKFLADLIERAKKAGEVRADVDAKTAALAGCGLLNGMVLLWLIERTVTDVPHFSLKDRAGPITKLFLRGIAA
jgi:TetR/AcrR family transcriptional regulator, acrAB operon repressor